MKRLLWFIPGLLILTGCEITTVVEPRYDNRDRMTGYYDVEEFSNTYNEYTYYTVRLSKYGSGNEIRLSNFYAVDISVYAYVNGDHITIPYQVVDGYAIEGVATYFGNGIDLTYSVKDTYQNTRTDFCESKAVLE